MGEGIAVADLEEYGIDRATLQRMYDEWVGGVPKSALEEKYLGKTSSHGKVFSTLVRNELGIETEQPSSMGAENARLRAENSRLRSLLDAAGIDADELDRAT